MKYPSSIAVPARWTSGPSRYLKIATFSVGLVCRKELGNLKSGFIGLVFNPVGHSEDSYEVGHYSTWDEAKAAVWKEVVKVYGVKPHTPRKPPGRPPKCH